MTRSSLPPYVRAAVERAKPDTRRPPTKVRRGIMNATEKRYASELEARKLAGEIRWWKFEGITLRIANGARYTPDFAILTNENALEFHEVKGAFVREAAIVRLKVAASLFPFRFILVQFSREHGQTSKAIEP